MNTNQLKRFAQEARRKLIQQITAKLDWVLQSDSPELREKTKQVEALNKALQQSSKEQVVEQVAYTWFNRFVALRFMDVNGYQPLMVQVLSSSTGEGDAEILQRAKQGNFSEELKLNKQRLLDLLDGRIPSNNAQNEVYRALLIASCNYLHTIFPFLFERIEDYSELLLPDDLISEFSIIHDVVEGMSAEDCQEVEILGWLYQFYISELNAKLISSKKAYKKNELAPASQLFTPKWIVQYMVDNTLGQLWAEMNPQTKVLENLEYYITPEYKEIAVRERKPLEEITFFEPCVGSGHVLAYAFDVFYKMYEEAGYLPSEIPFLILKYNLYGVDIDPRAAQIASFTLLMKARSKYRRFFRKIEQEHFIPNIYYYENFEDDLKFKNATTLGSLIRVTEEEVHSIQVEENTIFAENQQKLKDLYQLLGRKYDIVVTNPPYINSSRMEPSLKKYVNSSFADTKTDLFACFVMRNLELTNDDGLTGYMTPFVWMFISSYEKLRKEIISNHFINNLIQLEYSGFDGATVPICTFTLRNKHMDAKGSYIRLSDFKGSHNQAPKTLEAIQNPDCGWFYTKNQKEFKKIPGSNIGYWLSERMINLFEEELLGSILTTREGMATASNDRFLRFWSELDMINSAVQEFNDSKKWFPYNKGGSFRRWSGNDFYVVNWQNNGEEIKNNKDYRTGRIRSHNYNGEFAFNKGITWSALTSGNLSVRWTKEGYLFDSKGAKGFMNEEFSFKVLGLLNSKVAQIYLGILAPTLDYKVGDIIQIPFLNKLEKESEYIIENNITISTQEWNSRETSWDFLQNELIRFKGQDASTSLSTGIEEAIELYKAYWSKKFFELHQNEEELNAQFIEIYGLQEELTPDVPLDEITILKDELVQKELKQLSDNYSSNWQLNRNEWILQNKSSYPELPFDERELVQQFISYAVGCMFGRYSLDKEGLILANQGETIADYINIVSTNHQSPSPNHQQPITFMPDKDNIIPVLDNEWFADDIAARFKEFVRVVWGADSYQRNIKYIEDVLQKDIRRYFSRDFYADHIKRYKKRPIYWMFSSPKGAFNVLIYMHRYTPDTISNILNNYLREFIGKLELQIEQLERVRNEGTTQEQAKVEREINEYQKDLLDCQQYEREILFDLATKRIAIDLDNGVLVNYNKLGDAVALVSGLNDAKTRKKVEGFDWV